MSDDRTYHRFHLEKYRGRSTRYACPACGRPHCFTRYIDEEGAIMFPDDVGRCDHVTECGYHYKPSQFFAEHPDFSFEKKTSSAPATQPPEPPIALLDMQACECCRPYFKGTELCAYLEQLFGIERVRDVADLYRVGGYTDGSVVFPFINETGQLTTGKVIRYHGGHRGHDFGDTTYLHSLIRQWEYANRAWSPLILRQTGKGKEFKTSQCWFGAHLLTTHPDKPVAIVESEKTAMACAILQPAFVWLATSSMNCFRGYRAPNLKGRDVLVYPDENAVEEWAQHLSAIECQSIRIVPWYTLEEKGSKRDPADLIEDVLLAFQRGDESEATMEKAALLANSMRADFSFEKDTATGATSSASSQATSSPDVSICDTEALTPQLGGIGYYLASRLAIEGRRTYIDAQHFNIWATGREPSWEVWQDGERVQAVKTIGSTSVTIAATIHNGQPVGVSYCLEGDAPVCADWYNDDGLLYQRQHWSVTPSAPTGEQLAISDTLSSVLSHRPSVTISTATREI